MAARSSISSDRRGLTSRERALLRAMQASAGTVLHVEPPESWARLKPRVLPLLSGRSRAHGTIVGYPLCAVGESWRALANVSGPAIAQHPPCVSCGRATACSPPTAWNEDELQPFGPTGAEALWDRFHGRFCEATRAPRRELADRLIESHAGVLPEVWELEPSLVLSDRVEPTLRAVVFHGRLPEDGAELTRRLLASFWRWHELAGADVPRGLRELLEPMAPFELPIGFELGDGAPMLKAYVRLQHMSPDDRHALAQELAALAGRPALASLSWSDVHMIGLATRGGALVGLKLYVARDARAGWPELGLPAMPDDHPLEVLSSHRAYAVLDVTHPEARPHKWDYYLRERLLSGPMIAELARRLFSERVAREVATIARHHHFRLDAVAGAVRGSAWVLYCALA
jgi:hypothetical protein